MLADILNDSAAALILLEHHWAVRLRDAIARAGGFRISDGLISPLDLVAIGMLSAGGPGNFTRWRRQARPVAAVSSRHAGSMKCSEHAGSRAARAGAPRGGFRGAGKSE